MKTTDITPRTAKILMPIPILFGILLMFLFATSSCEAPKTENANKSTTDIIVNNFKIYNYNIDSCEYIGWIYPNYAGWATHKGNCKNSIHECQRQIIHDTIYLIKQGDKFIPIGKCKQ